MADPQRQRRFASVDEAMSLQSLTAAILTAARAAFGRRAELNPRLAWFLSSPGTECYSASVAWNSAGFAPIVRGRTAALSRSREYSRDAVATINGGSR
jgi:hypothetical protein